MNKLITLTLMLLTVSFQVNAEEPLVHYCEMTKKITVPVDGAIQEYPLTRFKIIDDSGKKIKFKISGFPNRLENIDIIPSHYNGDDWWYGWDNKEDIHYRFYGDRFFISTITSRGLMSIVSKCEKF